jgi:hypothetical protein
VTNLGLQAWSVGLSTGQCSSGGSEQCVNDAIRRLRLDKSGEHFYVEICNPRDKDTAGSVVLIDGAGGRHTVCDTIRNPVRQTMKLAVAHNCNGSPMSTTILSVEVSDVEADPVRRALFGAGGATAAATSASLVRGESRSLRQMADVEGTAITAELWRQISALQTKLAEADRRHLEQLAEKAAVLARCRAEVQ